MRNAAILLALYTLSYSGLIVSCGNLTPPETRQLGLIKLKLKYNFYLIVKQKTEMATG